MSRFSEKILLWRVNMRKFPWRKRKISPYEIFVAELLLKRTTATAVSKVYPTFIKKYPDITRLGRAKLKDITRIVNDLGYFKRAKELSSAAKYLQDNCKGAFPKDKRALLAIPYVGEYTANAILSLAYNKPYPMVDSNVQRIVSRVYFGKDYEPRFSKKVSDIMYKVLPPDSHRTFNLLMLDLGGTICLSRSPLCNECPLKSLCRFKKLITDAK